MLKELSIRNFAIIDDLQIGFSQGLTILSGETGAGKSIILNAVNLLLGSRASADLVRSGAESAELEALFEIAGSSRVAGIMSAHGYEASEGLLIRRIISRHDSNRVYINGRLATNYIDSDGWQEERNEEDKLFKALERLIEQTSNKLKHARFVEVFKDGSGYRESRDFPHYFTYFVERAEVTPGGGDLVWQLGAQPQVCRKLRFKHVF